MGLLDRVKSLLAAPPGGDPNILWLYVRCTRCGTPLAVRVDLRNEPSIDYETGGYVLNKEMMDGKCFTVMTARVRFDARRTVVEQTIDKGTFMTRDEYAKATAASGQG